MSKQKTFNVNGHKITVTTRRNVAGYAVRVTDNWGNKQSGSFSTLDETIAQERGYVKFIKAYGRQPQTPTGEPEDGVQYSGTL